MIGIVAVTGCSGDGTTTAAPVRASDPNDTARQRAADAARDLRDRLDTFARAHPETAELATSLADRHRQQLAVLGLASDDGTTAAPSGQDTAAELVSAERAAATSALTDLGETGPVTAALLAQLAASDAVYADLLASAARLDPPGDLPAPDRSDVADASATSDTVDATTVSAWSRMLADEFVAVYAFGVVTARVPSGRRSQADADWAAHRRRRDYLDAALTAANAPVPASLPAYDVGGPGDTEADMVELAVRVEQSTAELTAECLPLVRTRDRADTATALVASARRVAGWSRTVVQLPDFPVTP
jgi:hypothetical protein